MSEIFAVAFYAALIAGFTLYWIFLRKRAAAWAREAAGWCAAPVAAPARRLHDGVRAEAQSKSVAPWFIYYRYLAMGVFGVFAAAFLGLLGYAVWAFLSGAQDFFAAMQDLASFGALIVGFLGALSIPLVIERAMIQERQTKVQEKGNIADRIIRATQLLGATTEQIKIMPLITETEEGDAGEAHMGAERDELPEGRARKVTRQTAVPVQVPNIEVRLGAIYTLEAVARESAEQGDGQDHWPIMQTMLAYIRERRRPIVDDPLKKSFRNGYKTENPPPQREDYDSDEAFKKAQAEWVSAAAAAELAHIQSGALSAFARALRPDREDVLTAIGVLRRRSRRQLEQELGGPARARGHASRLVQDQWTPPERPFELAETNLQGADLRGVLWPRQSVAFARLEGANLEDARLQGANLYGARLQGANLYGARLQGANLYDARLQGANLYDARLQGANLWDARLQGANLYDARLQGANLYGARLQGANLGRAKMTGASLVGVSLTVAGRGAKSYAPGDGKTEDAAAKGLTQEQIDAAFGDAATAEQVAELGLKAPKHWDDETLVGWDDEADMSKAHVAWKAWRGKRGLPWPPTPEG